MPIQRTRRSLWRYQAARTAEPGEGKYVWRGDHVPIEDDWEAYERGNKRAHDRYERESPTIDRRYNPNAFTVASED